MHVTMMCHLNRWCPAVVVWLLCTGSVWAEPHACTQRGQTVEAAAAQAREWVARPVREVQVKGFSPAADIRHRVYDTPRPLRMWIIRIDLTAPGVRVAVTEPADLACEDAHCETLCANTLQFARQRGAQLAINASAFAPFRPHMGCAPRRSHSASAPDRAERTTAGHA